MNFFCRTLAVVLLCTLPLAAQTPVDASAAPPKRLRVALALSGGGSLGLAHIGVLRYFEEHHIPVDAIAGSSIGGLVGGLYATGHSPEEIERALAAAGGDRLLRIDPRYEDLPLRARQDRAEHPGSLTLRLGSGLSLPAGLNTAEALDLFLSRQVLAYSGEEDFDRLPTPFRCVATQLETGEAFVLRRGSLARAMRATMAVPGIFTPVDWEGRVLVDGGLVDNLPTDVARQMNADVVVAVHFTMPLPPAKQLQSLPNVLTQAVSVAVAVTERENLRTADLVLAPSLVGIGGIDFAHANELIERGYRAAEQKQRFLSTLALSDAEWAAWIAERNARRKNPPPELAEVVVHSPDSGLSAQARGELRGIQGRAALERALSKIVTADALPGAFYRLAADGHLSAELEQRAGSQLYVRPALDLAIANGEPTRATLRGFFTYLPRGDYGGRYRADFAVGYSPQLEASYERSLPASRWFVAPSLRLARENSASYLGEQHFTHWRDAYGGAFDLGVNLGSAALRLGAEGGYEALSAVSYEGARPMRDGAFTAPRMIVEWNSLDDPAWPAHGGSFLGRFEERYHAADARWLPRAEVRGEQNWLLGHGTLTLRAAAASSFGERGGYYDLFALGGGELLRPYRFQQFHAEAYGAGGAAWRHPFARWTTFGRPVQWGAWLESGGLREPAGNWQAVESGSLGLLLHSPLGVVTFAVGRTGDNQTRAWIRVGRP